MCLAPAVCLGKGKQCKDNNGLSVGGAPRMRGRIKRVEEVKRIYCQEPSISGNGYACIGVKQTCQAFSCVTEMKKKKQQRSY